MAAQQFYRIITEGGLQLITESGDYIIVAGVPPLPEPPDWLQDIIRVRWLIGDPKVGDFYLTQDGFPAVPSQNIAYVKYGVDPANPDFMYDGRYWLWKGNTMRPAAIIYSDSYIRDLLTGLSVNNAAKRLIKTSLLRIDAVYRLVSESDGGQSMGFHSLAELKTWYEWQLALLDTMNTPRPTIRRHRASVGYVFDQERLD